MTDFNKLRLFIKRFIKYLSNKGYQDTLEEVGDINLNATKIRFNRLKTDPFGKEWVSLSPKYLKWKIRTHGSSDILILSGKLRDSVQKKVKKLKKSVNLFVGTNVKYGKYHQYGTTKMPQRSFLGFTDKEVENCQDKLIEAFSKF